MNPENVVIVQQSFQQVLKCETHPLPVLMLKLSRVDPLLTVTFYDWHWRRKLPLMRLLEAVIDGLGDNNRLWLALAGLGNGTPPRLSDSQYATIGQVALETLREVLGESFTPPTQAAWVEAYRHVVKHLREGRLQPAPSKENFADSALKTQPLGMKVGSL